MSLDPTTLEPIVEAWSSARSTSWSAAEKAAVAFALQELSARVTPRVVPDEPRAAAREQEILTTRAIEAIEAWLSRAAAAVRHSLGVQAPALVEGGPQLALGLRSASYAELEGLPGVDDELAEELARHPARHPALGPQHDDLEGLLAVDGVGPQRLARLRRLTYLDQPRVRLVSPTLWSFALDPRVETFLDVLEHSDLAFSYGDHTAIERRLPSMGGTVPRRLVRLIEVVAEQAERRASMVDGVLASEAVRRLQRHDQRVSRLAAVAPVTGRVLVDDAYVAAVHDLIEAATTTIDLVTFMRTAAPGGPDPGPLALVDALEAAVGRGVTVRVILDRDDGGASPGTRSSEPSLALRMRRSGLAVRLARDDARLGSRVLVVDRHTVVLGSHDWTRTGLRDVHQISLLLQGHAVARDYDARFQGLWDRLPAEP